MISDQSQSDCSEKDGFWSEIPFLDSDDANDYDMTEIEQAHQEVAKHYGW